MAAVMYNLQNMSLSCFILFYFILFKFYDNLCAKNLILGRRNSAADEACNQAHARAVTKMPEGKKRQ